MAWIKIVDQSEAEGPLLREYKAALRRAGKIYNIVKISSLKPEVLRASMAFYSALMQAPAKLSRAQREMVAVAVSRANDCHY